MGGRGYVFQEGKALEHNDENGVIVRGFTESKLLLDGICISLENQFLQFRCCDATVFKKSSS